MQPGRHRRLVTAGLMLGVFLAALEATAVAAAMPTVVGELGGVDRYSWVFSIYLLAATVTVPLYGKLADLFGRRRVYLVAVALFLAGSALSGTATSIDQLIAFRGLQGLGAGGVMPVAVTLIGDLFNLEERGRMQGLFSGVWGVSSLAGPALGGLVTDLASWRWVFYLNLPFGLASATLLALYLEEADRERQRRPLDLAGAATLIAAVSLLLVGLDRSGRSGLDGTTAAYFAAAAIAAGLFLFQERRTAEPILPLDLFDRRLIAVASGISAAMGALLYAASAFVPMYGQGVLGGGALDAGLLLAPVSVGWPAASMVAGRLILVVGYRRIVLTGGVLVAGASALLASVTTGGGGASGSRLAVMAVMLLLGVGLGLLNTPQTVAVQSAVPWRRRGVATSSLQFFRAIGGAIAVAALGALATSRLGGSTDALFDPALRTGLAPAARAALAADLAAALRPVFFGVAVLGTVTAALATLFPGGSARDLAVPEEAGVEGELP